MMSQYNVTKLNISELVERTSDSLSRKIDITVEALQVKSDMETCTCTCT